MLKRHYNSREIINHGETQIDALLSDLIYTETNWHSIAGLLLAKNRCHKTGRGEIDFILICEYGVLVLEVKGGLIHCTEGKLFQKEVNGDSERPIDPFGQVRGNVETIKQFLQSRLPFQVFVGEAVLFPQSAFNYHGASFKHFWHMSAPQKLGAFLEQTLKMQAASFGFEKLRSKEIGQVLQALLPEVNWESRPEKLRHARQESEKRSWINYKILKGLEGNDRLLIEGPPGSGKSFFAHRFILDKITRESSRVLYLCWNELLAVHARHLFYEHGVAEQVMALSFFDYINLLYIQHPVAPRKLGFDDVPHLRSQVDAITADLKSVLLLETYDFIVVDEAQDLFDKGIDLVLDRQLHDGVNGLSKGNYLVFYDTLQAFGEGIDTEMYQLVFHSIRSASAYYRLQESFRSLEGSGIAHFLDNVMKGSIDFNQTYGSDMVIKTYQTEADCLPLIKSTLRTVIHVERVQAEDIVLLFSSNLVSGGATVLGGKPLDGVLLADRDFEKISNENLSTHTNRIRYTTALKYKGLEKDLVILVIKDLFDEKIKTFYQLFIGASRAKAKVVLLIDEESVRWAKKQRPSLEAMLANDSLVL